mgnify:CR=1
MVIKAIFLMDTTLTKGILDLFFKSLQNFVKPFMHIITIKEINSYQACFISNHTMIMILLINFRIK